MLNTKLTNTGPRRGFCYTANDTASTTTTTTTSKPSIKLMANGAIIAGKRLSFIHFKIFIQRPASFVYRGASSSYQPELSISAEKYRFEANSIVLAQISQEPSPATMPQKYSYLDRSLTQSRCLIELIFELNLIQSPPAL